jgi:putative spermidine/putrescine transport system substrate-binding protein
MKRRGFLNCTIILVFVLLLTLGIKISPAKATTEVVINTWGGAFLEAFNAVESDIERVSGVNVKMTTHPGAAAGLSRLIAQKDNPQVDLFTGIESTAFDGGKAGVFEELNPTLIPNMGKVPKELIMPHGVSIWVSLRGIFYRADMVPFEIKKWEDLWDSRLKGKVATSILLDKGNFLVMAALLAGGSENNIDPGFEKVKVMKPNIVLFYKTDSESIKFLQAGEAAVAGWGILPNVYKLLGPGSNYKFVIPEKPQFLAPIPISLVKGRPNKEQSLKVINAILTKEIQEKLAQHLGVVPAVTGAQSPEKIRDIVPSLKNIYKMNWDVVNANFDKWFDRWNKEIQVK